MTTRIQKVGYFHFEVEDRAGEGARVLGKLRDAKVNLLSFVAFPTGGGRAKITVIPEKPDDFAAAAKVGLTPSVRKECFLVQGDDHVGAAYDVVKRLAEAKISFTAGHACSSGKGAFGMVLFVKPQELAAAAKALGV